MTDPDWTRVAAHLATHGMAWDSDPSPRRFPGGLANINTLVHVDGRLLVLRRPPPGPLPPGAHDMAREHRILSRLPDALPFVPRSVHLCTDTSVLGVPFQLIEYRPGRVIHADLPPDLAGQPGIAAGLSETMLQTLASIHGADTQALGLGDLGRPDGFLRRAVEGWRRRGAAVQDARSGLALDELGAWLDANLVPDGPAVMLHNDFKLDNMILDDSLQPNAVVDWDQGTRGDGLFDLGTMLSYWTEATDPPAMQDLRQMPTAAPGFWTREQAALRYAALTGRDLSDIRFHRVLGIMKLGVIFLQLHALHVRGATADPRYATFGPLAGGLLEFALEVKAGRHF